MIYEPDKTQGVNLTKLTHDELLYGIKEIERLAEGMWGTKALRAVVELHKPSITRYISNYIGCDNCSSTSGFVLYPCLTIQAIEKALG